MEDSTPYAHGPDPDADVAATQSFLPTWPEDADPRRSCALYALDYASITKLHI
jgi:hypothetical protein